MRAEYETTYSARTYLTLLKTAKLMLEISSAIKNKQIDSTLFNSQTQINGIDRNELCDMVALDYSISALEAFINHMGYILIDDWVSFGTEERNFWEQYKKVLAALENVINLSLYDVPYPKFKEHRTLRNSVHHPHASAHDSYFERGECEANELSGIEYLQQLTDIKLFVRHDDASLAYIETESFISSFREAAKKLNRKAMDLKNDRLRLFDDFIKDYPINYFSTRTSLIKQ